MQAVLDGQRYGGLRWNGGAGLQRLTNDSRGPWVLLSTGRCFCGVSSSRPTVTVVVVGFGASRRQKNKASMVRRRVQAHAKTRFGD